MAAPSFLLFDFVDAAHGSQCCSGRHRSTMARVGDLVILPADYAPAIIKSMPGALKPIKGRALTAAKKAAGVSSVEALADLPHSELQRARVVKRAASRACSICKKPLSVTMAWGPGASHPACRAKAATKSKAPTPKG